MILTLVIACLVFIGLILSIIFLPKIKIKSIQISSYWVIALIGAVLMISTLRISFGRIAESLFSNNTQMNPIKILILFFSMTFISIFLEHAGFFKFIANYAAKKAKSKQITLFIIMYFLVSLLTVFTSNDIVILTFTPFICYFCKNSKINPLPYLIAEFAAANTWSMMLIIGNPTNMYLGANAGIEFVSYFQVMAIPTLVAGLVEFGIIFLIFRKSLGVPLNIEIDDAKLTNPLDTILGLAHLIICIVLLAMSNFLQSVGFDIEMWSISLCVAGSLFIYMVISGFCKKTIKNSTISIGKSLPWALIPFVISMFIIVLSLEEQGVSELLTKFLGSENTIWTYGPMSFVFANLINNIPMSILFSILPNFNGIEYYNAIYASIIGSNIGAFLTPIGALAGIMFTSLLKEHDVKLTFGQFSLYGIIIAIPTLVVSLLLLSIIL